MTQYAFDFVRDSREPKALEEAYERVFRAIAELQRSLERRLPKAVPFTDFLKPPKETAVDDTRTP